MAADEGLRTFRTETATPHQSASADSFSQREKRAAFPTTADCRLPIADCRLPHYITVAKNSGSKNSEIKVDKITMPATSSSLFPKRAANM